tara:strand:+ start:1416 stop:1736 length:321 start_codon:yes stop_codon:yes gene_type:complete
MKLGISVKIDVSKIDKSRLYKGQKGTYLDLTTFINTSELDQYDNNGFISQSMTKEERESGVEKTPILGNVKVFYSEELAAQPAPQPASQQAKPDSTTFADLEEIPF